MPDEIGWRPPLFTTDEFPEIRELIAHALTIGPWREEDLVARAGGMLTRRWRGLKACIGRMMDALGRDTRPTQRRIADFLRDDEKFRSGCGIGERPSAKPFGVNVDPSRLLDAVMWPASGGPASWSVPAIVTPEALAERLGLGLNELEWLADCQGREVRQVSVAEPRYRLRFIPKRNGSVRLIEVPNARLKAIQRVLLREVVSKLPPHDAAHGFRAGRSVRSYVEPHIGRRVVLKLDLRDFFPTISGPRVRSLFMRAGYPEPVARLMTGLATNRVPSRVFRERTDSATLARRLFAQPHLPQGAATSPALANACAFRLDMRLSGLARAAGGVYTRYADDLAFSGGRDLERSIGRLIVHIMAIAIEEGFEIQPRKTRVMRESTRQHIAGAVINVKPNVRRGDFDILKATLHNCVKTGPASQNRGNLADFRAHLLGRISHVGTLNPERGKRLKAVFERISWQDTTS